MNKTIFIFLFLLITLVGNVLAVCTASTDDINYAPLETATGSFTISTGAEKNLACNATWFNGSVILQIEPCITPNDISTIFFEQITFGESQGGTDGYVNLTIDGGTTCQSNLFNISGVTSTQLRIVNATFANNLLISKTGGVSAMIIDSNGLLVSNVRCGLDLIDQQGNHLTRAKEELISYDGHITFGIPLSIDSLVEDTEFATFIHCNCGLNGTDRTCQNEEGNSVPPATGSVEAIFKVGKWLTINTITSKARYNLDEEQILICANVSSNQRTRIPIRILYSYRCDGGTDNSTDRILLPENPDGTFGKEQERGIDGNTTENQCAALEIQNRITLQNKINICKASTDVEVLSLDESRVLIAYHTTSEIFNITSNSNIFTEVPDKMASFSVTFFILIVTGVIFWLSFREQLIEVVSNKTKYVNFLLKRAALIIAIFLMTLNSAIMATIAANGNLNLTNEMFMYMQMFGWAGYVAILILVFTSLVKLMQMWKEDADDIRLGDG